jgi:hypothetical protein
MKPPPYLFPILPLRSLAEGMCACGGEGTAGRDLLRNPTHFFGLSPFAVDPTDPLHKKMGEKLLVSNENSDIIEGKYHYYRRKISLVSSTLESICVCCEEDCVGAIRVGSHILLEVDEIQVERSRLK